MAGIADVPLDRLAQVKAVLADIDDTISTHGKLGPQAYGALWRLRDAGLIVIPITGRPAGWCDHIARFWPVNAVVGENGGLYFFHDGHRLRRRFLLPDRQRRESRRQLDAIRETVLAEVPGTAVASDQPYRECDLAIDYCEDVPLLPREAVLRIKDIFERAGAHTKVSSIHVNGWFGEYDKLSTTLLCMKELFGIDLDVENESAVFCGDSPNDEPMFAFFKLSFGMANITRYQGLLVHEPAYVTGRTNGDGFCEVVDLVLCARQAVR